MKARVMRLLSLAICILLTLPLTAWGERERNIYFKHLTSEQGLSGEFVRDVTQDSRGHIWFATQSGLNRWDGKSIVVYEHNAADQTSISHNFVHAIYSDPNGDLWVASNGGVDRYDYESDAFERDPFGNAHLLQNMRARNILQDARGDYWVGTVDSGLIRIDRNLQSYHYLADRKPGSLPHNNIISLVEGRDGRLWIGTDGGGIAYFDPHSNRFVTFKAEPAKQSSLLSNDIRTLYSDGKGFLWIGTNLGLSRMDISAGTFVSFQHQTDNDHTLSQGQVLSIVEDDNGTLWVGTEKGLSEYQPKFSEFVRYDESNQLLELRNWQVNDMFQDRSGVLWLATNGGVSSWNYISDAFTQYSTKTGHLNVDLVTSISEGASGALWIGTYGGGLTRLSIPTDTSTTFTADHKVTNAISDDRVMAVHVDRADRVWIGTRDGGLNLILPDDTFRHYKHDPSNPNSISGNAISAITSTSDGAIWIGAFGSGLNRLDTTSGEITRYVHDPEQQSSLSSNRVLSLLEDRTGRLWIGTEDGGLNLFDSDTNTFHRYSLYPTDNFDSRGTAWALTEDLAGTLWVGTMNQGLLSWSDADRTQGVVNFQRFGNQLGLPSSIQGIAIGTGGELWASSNRGLFELNLATNSVVQYNQSSGLRISDFLQGAYLRGRDGNLYFGSNQGLLAFSPHEIKRSSKHAEIHLTAHSREAILAKTASSDNKLVETKLNTSDPFITFDFAALDYVSPENNRYRYILRGFDSDWIDADRYAHAVYSNLPPGQYQFEVIAANNSGAWTPRPASIHVDVPPPLYLSNSAYALYGVCVLILAYLVLSHRRKARARDIAMRIHLEQQVQERTQELEEGYAELQKLNERLEEVSVTDSLTGLKNRRFVDGYLETEVAKMQRQRPNSTGPDSVMYFMMIDLDGFKAVNDQYGHNAGDELLVQVSNILRSLVRASDIVVRWGGDEFMVIGHSSTFAGVKVLAERIREALDLSEFTFQGGSTKDISSSIGIAPFPFAPSTMCQLSWEQVSRIADRGTYIAKENGRNAWVSLCGTEKFRVEDVFRVAAELDQLTREGKLLIDSAIERDLILEPQDIAIAAR